jgi:hypothetical protein
MIPKLDAMSYDLLNKSCGKEMVSQLGVILRHDDKRTGSLATSSFLSMLCLQSSLELLVPG